LVLDEAILDNNQPPSRPKLLLHVPFDPSEARPHIGQEARGVDGRGQAHARRNRPAGGDAARFGCCAFARGGSDVRRIT
jgi:hypothetical protein